MLLVVTLIHLKVAETIPWICIKVVCVVVSLNTLYTYTDFSAYI